MAAAVYGGQPLEGLIQAGALAVEGDRAMAARFVTLFVLPPKVGATA
jgi:ubiquinone biosynthesis protein UbiJ